MDWALVLEEIEQGRKHADTLAKKLSAYKSARWQMRHNSAHLKPDAEKLCTHNRHRQSRRFGLRSSYGQVRLVLVSRDNHLPMAHGDGKQIPRVLTLRTPDPFDERRV